MATAQMAALAPAAVPAAAPVTAPPVTQQPVMQQPITAQPLMATPIEDRVAAAQPRAAYSGGPGPNVQLAVIQFGQGSAGLTGSDYPVLQRVAEIQRVNRATIRIVAHAAQDSDGSSADSARANYEVSRRRALAVATQLVRLGVPADRIVAEAASDALPIYETRTARGLAANRRVEIFIEI